MVRKTKSQEIEELKTKIEELKADFNYFNRKSRFRRSLARLNKLHKKSILGMISVIAVVIVCTLGMFASFYDMSVLVNFCWFAYFFIMGFLIYNSYFS